MSRAGTITKPRVTEKQSIHDYYGVDGVTRHVASITVGGSVIGDVSAYQFTMTLNPRDLWFDADAISGDLEFVAAHAIGLTDNGHPGRTFDARIEDIIDADLAELCESFIILDTVYLAPEHRGQGYGPAATLTFLSDLAKQNDEFAVVVLHPYALPDPGNDRLKGKAKTTADTKIRHAWSSIGFTAVPDSPLMVTVVTPPADYDLT